MILEGFGYKAGWIAIRNATPDAVASALGLRNARPCDWSKGIEMAYDHKANEPSIFITPAIDGWVLYVGSCLLDLGFAFFDETSSAAQSPGYWERTDLTFADESHVMAIASRWSIDPTSLDGRELDVSEGLVGDFGGRPSKPPDRHPANKRPWWKIW